MEEFIGSPLAVSRDVQRQAQGGSAPTRSATFAHVLVLGLFAALPFVPILLANKALIMGDLCHMFHPGYIFMRDALLDEALPLWNPYMACGEPFLADIERGVFYPPNLIYLVLPVSVGIVVSAAFHVFVAMTGVYALCRTWSVSGVGSLMAALAYGWSSYLLTKVAFPSEFGSACWLPWVLAAFVWLIDRPTSRRVAGLSLAIAMQFLAGFPETVVYTVFCLGLYALRTAWWAWWRGAGWIGMARPFFMLGVGGCLAIILVFAQLLPTMEAMGLSERSDTVDPQLDASSVHPMSVFTLLIPSLYGTNSLQGAGYWAPSCLHYSCGTYYLGVIPMMALLAAFVIWLAGPKQRDRGDDGNPVSRSPVLYLIVVCAIFFFYSMGRYSGLFHLCWHAVPLLQRFTWPSKCLFAVTLSLACLSGFALDYVAFRMGRAARSWTPARRRIAQWLPLAIVLAAGAYVGVCFLKEGELGVWTLRRFFNLDAVKPRFEHFISWLRIAVDSAKFAVLGVLAILGLRVYAVRPRWRSLVGALLIVLLAGDLYLSNAYVLEAEPREVLEGASNYRDVLRPEDPIVRFLGMENTFRKVVSETLEPLAVDARILECPYECLDEPGSSRDLTMSRIQRDMMTISWPMADRAFDLKSNGNFVPEHVARLTAYVVFPAVPSPTKRRLLHLLNCDRIVLPVPPGRFITGQIEHGVRVAVLDPPMPRAYVVGGLEIMDTPDQVRTSFVLSGYDPWTHAKTDRQSARQAGVLKPRKPSRVSHSVRDLRYDHNRVSLEVESSQPGWLILTDTYYPGWRATVNGKPKPILKVNSAFRGVWIERGVNKVEMTYWPEQLTYGLVGSGLGIVTVLVLLLRQPRRNRTTDSPSTLPHRQT